MDKKKIGEIIEARGARYAEAADEIWGPGLP